MTKILRRKKTRFQSKLSWRLSLHTKKRFFNISYKDQLHGLKHLLSPCSLNCNNKFNFEYEWKCDLAIQMPNKLSEIVNFYGFASSSQVGQSKEPFDIIKP